LNKPQPHQLMYMTNSHIHLWNMYSTLSHRPSSWGMNSMDTSIYTKGFNLMTLPTYFAYHLCHCSKQLHSEEFIAIICTA